MNNDNELVKWAKEKIRCDEKYRSKCCVIVGPTGATGPTGPTSETPTLTIGEVTTGEPGTEAEASITGTAPNFLLNLTIPQGPTGPTGVVGQDA